MKNMIELPTRNDFYKTESVEILVYNAGLNKVHYRKCNIAMRSITDFTSIEMDLEVQDEEKMPEYEKALEEFKEKMEKSFSEAQFSNPLLQSKRPKHPTKKIKIIGTMVLYLNGAYRIIVDDFDDFETVYFDYLTAQKLDILKSN